MRLSRAWRVAVALVLCAAPLAIANVHPGTSAHALLKSARDGRVEITLRHDALAFALNETPASIADGPMLELLAATDEELAQALADGKDRFATLFALEADGRRVDVEIVHSPTTEEVRAWQRDHTGVVLPVKLDFVARAQLPAGTRRMRARFPEVLGDVIVTFDRPEIEPMTMPMRGGEWTPDVELEARMSEREVPMSALEIVWRYIALGFTHIVPHGLDHVLFVLGLFFLSPKLKALLWQVTAFTLAHSITLALTIAGRIDVSPAIVEPIIAASIALVAIENVATDRVHAWRPVVVFVFGLVHGLGFAGVLREMGLPRGELATAVVAFNVGVELGQIAVIAVAFALTWAWRDRKWYRRRVAIPASVAIAAVGLFWTVQRLM